MWIRHIITYIICTLRGVVKKICVSDLVTSTVGREGPYEILSLNINVFFEICLMHASIYTYSLTKYVHIFTWKGVLNPWR